MKLFLLLLCLIGSQTRASTRGKAKTDLDLKNYPIPIPVKPYPVVGPNVYRSDNAWGETRTASQSEDQFQVEVQKEDGSRVGVSVYKSPDGRIQKQYYEAGSRGYEVKMVNPFLESAPKRIQPRSIAEPKKDVDTKSAGPPLVLPNDVVEDRGGGEKVVESYVESVSPGRLAAGLVRAGAFDYKPSSVQELVVDRSDSEVGSGNVDKFLSQAHGVPSAPAENPFHEYSSILQSLRPSPFLNKLFPLPHTPAQVSFSRPQTVSLAGPSGDSDAITSGTALAGPGSLAIAAPESIAIAGPGGAAFSTATGISSVDTDFNNADSEPTIDDTLGPIIISAPFLTGRPYRRRGTSNYGSPLPPTRYDGTSFLDPLLRTFYRAVLRGRGNPTPYTGQDERNLVFDKGNTVIAPPNANVALFYHHQAAPHRTPADPWPRVPFTFQQHGAPSFYYFQY